LLVFESGVPRAGNIFQLVAVVIVGSIVAHSSTDVIVARWFSRLEKQAAEPEQEQEPEREVSGAGLNVSGREKREHQGEKSSIHGT